MYLLISIFIVIISIFLILLVMIQNSKGGGLAAGFSSSNQVMGVRKTTDFLEKATWSLAGFIVVLSIATSFFKPNKSIITDSSIRDEIQNVVPFDQNTLPDFSAPMQEEE